MNKTNHSQSKDLRVERNLDVGKGESQPDKEGSRTLRKAIKKNETGDVGMGHGMSLVDQKIQSEFDI